MKRFLPPFVVLILGVCVSILLLLTVTSRAGVTITSLAETHFLGWNLVCFWGDLTLAIALSCYLYLHQSTHRSFDPRPKK